MDIKLNYENIVYIGKFSNFKSLLNLSYISKFFNSILQKKIKKRFNNLSWTILIEYTTNFCINIKNISLILGIPYNYETLLYELGNNYHNKKTILYIGKIKDIINYIKFGEMFIILHLDNKKNIISLVNNYDQYDNGCYYYQTVFPKIQNLDKKFFNNYTNMNYTNEKLPYNSHIMISHTYKKIKKLIIKNE